MAVYLGVDGGGTQTRAILVDAEGTILQQATTGSSNINQVGEPALAERLGKLCASMRCADETVYACFGLAGSSSPTNQTSLNRILSKIEGLHPERIHLCSDADIALQGAFQGSKGMILIAGTGSICLADNSDGKITRIGGWGTAAGDPGSGHWIGNQAISIALKQADGRLSETQLKSEIFTQLEITRLSEITERLHTPALSRNKIAALCPIICDLAETDRQAAKILNQAVSDLVEMVIAGKEKLGIGNVPVCPMGGVLSQKSRVRNLFINELSNRVSNIRIQDPELSALAGATLLARKLDHTAAEAPFAKAIADLEG